MYGSFGQIWRGLRKNAYAGMDYMPHKYVTGAIIALTLAWAPWVALGLGLAGGSLGSWPRSAGGESSPRRRPRRRCWSSSACPPPFAFTLPAGITAYVAIATSGVWHHHRGRILWKDRVIRASTVMTPSEARPEGASLNFASPGPEFQAFVSELVA